MNLVEVKYGRISLKAPAEWFFFPTEKFLLARRQSQIGVVRIRLAEDNPLPENDEELLAAAARGIGQQELPPPFDTKKPFDGDYRFGAASYRIDSNAQEFFIRALYLLRTGDLLLAGYGCPWGRREEEAAGIEQNECERMILTARIHPRDEAEP